MRGVLAAGIFMILIIEPSSSHTYGFVKTNRTWNVANSESENTNTTNRRKYCSSSRNMSAVMAKIMKRSRYDIHTVPSFQKGKPLEIKLALSVLVFRDMKEVDMTYTVDFFLRTKWTDKRLQNPLDCTLTMTMGKKHPAQVIWVPDTMIENSVTSNLHEVLTNNHKLDILPEGEVFWSTRVTVKAMCKMNLVKYPRDKQTCSIVLLSYAYSTDLVHYVWDTPNPVGVMDKTLSQFDVTSYKERRYNRMYAAGEYSILEAEFVFERRLGYYLIQVYIPCIFLVALAGLSFWMEAKATAARVALGLTTLLTIATIWSSANSNMPPVSYVKAIDIYFLTSFCFVLTTLLEYIVLLNYHYVKHALEEKFKSKPTSWQKEEKNSLCLKHQSCFQSGSMNPKLEENVELRNRHTTSENRDNNHVDNGNNEDSGTSASPVSNIDKVTRLIYPTAYITFNIIYWYQLRRD